VKALAAALAVENKHYRKIVNEHLFLWDRLKNNKKRFLEQ